MDTALVTGGAGFLGSHVAERLLTMGLRVVVVDDLSGGFRRSIPEGCEFRQGSITDDRFIDELFAEHRFTYVYHLAAYAAEGLSHFIRRFNYTNNVVGSANLINASVNHDVCCFVFTSSIAVYGSARVPISEETVPIPEDPYGIAKLAVERDLEAAGRMFGLRSIVFRPHNVYGERQNLADPYRNVVGIFMNQVLHRRPCTVFGDGTQTRAFSYVADVAPVIAESVGVSEAHGGTFNLGADQACTVNELARMVQRVLGRETGIQYLPARKEVQHAWCAHDRAKRTFQPARAIPLEEGLERMARWASTLEIRPPRRFESIEIEKDLPSWVNRCSER
jgi:UDP-glucose 4-epimerase